VASLMSYLGDVVRLDPADLQRIRTDLHVGDPA
jgi:hypothetical protein